MQSYHLTEIIIKKQNIENLYYIMYIDIITNMKR